MQQLDWETWLKSEQKKTYYQKIISFLSEQRLAGKIIFPKQDDILNAFTLTPLNKVSVVILGQDPYHGPNQAHGLAFSVLDNAKLPPSLKNIYKELESDLGIKRDSGDLSSWAKSGVLLLNTCLTVEQGLANSHAQLGWDKFSENVLLLLNQLEPIVFACWGNSAIEKVQSTITNSRHKILTAPHPSPLSAYRGFFGCKHFSKINTFLEDINKTPIDWS